MFIKPIKVRTINAGDDIFSVFSKKVKRIREGSIIVIASKIVSYQQGRITDAREFKKILKKESQYVSRKEVVENIWLTVKDGMLLPNAGIDYSNIEKGKIILLPRQPQKEAEKFRERAIRKYKIKRLGVLIIDSHCQPLRRGTLAVTLGCAGFEPVKDERGKKDIFGNEMKVTRIAIADSLACAAHSVMGESSEKTPFVIIAGARISFTNKKIRSAELQIKPRECLFRELYPKNLV